MALSIQAGTEAKGLCCWGGCCGCGAEAEEEEEGKEGLGMDSRLGARDVLGVVRIFEVRVSMVGEFTSDVTERAGF